MDAPHPDAGTSRHAADWPAGRERIVPPAPSTIDLHTHTARSDGLLEPADLVAQVAAAGVRLAAITDHDSLAAYRELHAPGVTLPAGLELVPGIEINAVVAEPLDTSGEYHLLGYGIDPDDERFERTLVGQRSQRRDRFERIVARLRELGMPIEAELERLEAERALGGGDPADDALGRPTAARALVLAGHATSVEDAFDRILSRGRPGYVPRAGLHPVGAIRAITLAGGLASLAHFYDVEARRKVVAELASMGLGGLEVHHRSFDRPMVEAAARVAADLRLVATGGSDYHGDDGPYADVHHDLWVPPPVEGPFRAAVGRAAAGHRLDGGDGLTDLADHPEE